MSNRLSLYLAAGIAAGSQGVALAQCDNWITSPSRHAPLRGLGLAMASYTPPGQSMPRLFLGGGNINWQGTDLGSIAQWDGFNWQPVGSGLDYSGVHDLVNWISPTGGVSQVLVATGDFSKSGSTNMKNIAFWDGSFWNPMGLGIRNTGGSGSGNALTTWDPDGAGPLGVQLIVGGQFQLAGNASASNIARWDGNNWHPIGAGLDGEVLALTTWDRDGSGSLFTAELVVGGMFKTAGGVTSHGIARYNGSWQSMGGMHYQPDPGTEMVRALTTWDPDGAGPQPPRLLAAGTFTHAGGTPAPGIAAYDGNVWTGFGSSVAPGGWHVTTWDADGNGPQIAMPVFVGGIPAGPGYLQNPVIWNGSTWEALGKYGAPTSGARLFKWDPDGPGLQGQQLLAAGTLNTHTPTGFAMGAMRLVGNEWQHFGSSPVIYAAENFAGSVVVGGEFQMDASGGAHGTTAINLAGFTGALLPTAPGAVTGPVRALKSYSTTGTSHLVVGGSFNNAGGAGVSNIARYAISNNVLQSGWFQMGQGLNGSVHAIERLGTTVFAGGSFTASGFTALGNIAQYNGTNWVGAGFGMNGTVLALKVFNNSLYAGGTFTIAGGNSTGSLTRWTGSNWTSVGGFFPGSVFALEVHNNEMVIGGSFSGTSGPNIARYNGTTFSNMGSGGANGPVWALEVGPDGHLYAGGGFTTIGGVSASRVARWNGSSWSGVRNGVNGQVYALLGNRNEVHVLGSFGKAGTSEIASAAWARYTVDGVPWIAKQPLNQEATCVGKETVFGISHALGYVISATTWRKDGQVLTPGPTPWGSQINYFTTGPSSLVITNVQVQDEGTYEATLTASCGAVTTSAATLKVCYANCDCSASSPVLNVADFGCYLTRFAAGDPWANCDQSTTSPVLNVADFGCFLARFAAGCP